MQIFDNLKVFRAALRICTSCEIGENIHPIKCDCSIYVQCALAELQIQDLELRTETIQSRWTSQIFKGNFNTNGAILGSSACGGFQLKQSKSYKHSHWVRLYAFATFTEGYKLIFRSGITQSSCNTSRKRCRRPSPTSSLLSLRSPPWQVAAPQTPRERTLWSLSIRMLVRMSLANLACRAGNVKLASKTVTHKSSLSLSAGKFERRKNSRLISLDKTVVMLSFNCQS